MSDSDWKIIGESLKERQLANWSQHCLIQLPKRYQYVQAMAAFGHRVACQNVAN